MLRPSRYITKATFKLLWHHFDEHKVVWITFFGCVLCVILIPRCVCLYQLDDDYTLIMNLSYSYIAGFVFYFLNEFVSDLQTRIFSYNMIKKSLNLLNADISFVMPSAVSKGAEPYKYYIIEDFLKDVPEEWRKGEINMNADDYLIFDETIKDINKEISALCNVYSRYLRQHTIEIVTDLQREVNNYTHTKDQDIHIVKYDSPSELLRRLYYSQWYFLNNSSYYDLH